jgi:tRNA(Arg) A34 adenosine deaminase TadA
LLTLIYFYDIILRLDHGIDLFMSLDLNKHMETPMGKRPSLAEAEGAPDIDIGIDEIDSTPQEFEAVHYYPDGSFEEERVFLSGLEIASVAVALEHANHALESGNPPVGALLLIPDPENRGSWLDFGGSAADKTEKDIIDGHAEIRAWRHAQKAGAVGSLLDQTVAIETVPPCSSCGPRLAEGRINKIVVSATRREGWDASGGHTMRQRQYNMHHMFTDGHTDTVVVRGPGREAVLAKYTMWAGLHGFDNAPAVSEIPQLSLLEDLMITPQRAHAIKSHAS